MRRAPSVWPRGTGQWSRLSETRTVVVSSDPHDQTTDNIETLIVATPLDVIARLEDHNSMVSTVILEDPRAHRELASFLHETYPWLQVIAHSRD